jgi:DNA (cytosine-5)-methyltransferase 1
MEFLNIAYPSEEKIMGRRENADKENKINELALFAGAGGGILASELLGWRTVCAVEIEPYATSILIQRQNDGFFHPFPIWDDIRSFKGEPWRGSVNLVSGGFPCQAFSTATHGRSTAADLWPEMFRIVDEVKPRLVFAENVSIKAISKAAADCRKGGYRTKTLALSAADLGADHNRSRYWLLAYADDSRQLLSSFNVQARGVQELYPRIWSKEPEGWTRESVNERHGLYSKGFSEAERGSKVVALRGKRKSSSEPNRPRVVDGVARWMDRYKATGNGQVPAVAAAAFLALAYFAERDLRGEENNAAL